MILQILFYNLFIDMEIYVSSLEITSASTISCESTNSFLFLSIQLFIPNTRGFDPRYIKKAVGRTLIIPTAGFLNMSRPAFTLKRIINIEGIKILKIVLRASVHPTRYIPPN